MDKTKMSEQLKQLIDLFQGENPGKGAMWSKRVWVIPGLKRNSPMRETFTGYTDDFMNWLASRPTCGKEQRKFLDEVISSHSTVYFTKDKLAAVKIFEKDKTKLEPLYLNQSDFESDLSKVIKGE